MKHMLGPDYYDLLVVVCDLLRCGFPITFNNEKFHFTDIWKYRNHSGANEFPDEINRYSFTEQNRKFILDLSITVYHHQP